MHMHEELKDENDKLIAVVSYDEQKKRKLEFEAMVSQWRDMTRVEQGSRTSDDKKSGNKESSFKSKSRLSQLSHSSSNSSIISKKRNDTCKIKIGAVENTSKIWGARSEEDEKVG